MNNNTFTTQIIHAAGPDQAVVLTETIAAGATATIGAVVEIAMIGDAIAPLSGASLKTTKTLGGRE